MNLNETSKYIALILRHKPETIGKTLDEHGWASVKELIAGVARNEPFTMETLEEIVAMDNKTRYSFNEDKTLVRANHGHSVLVDVELEEKTPPSILYHGTGEKYVDSIMLPGLKSKSRLYVHSSSEVSTAARVGGRHEKPFIYQVDAEKMYEAGYKFFLSPSSVWLTKEVPVEYLILLKERTK